MRSLTHDLDGMAATWDEPANDSERLPLPQAAALVSLASIVLWLGIVGLIAWIL